MSINDQVRLHFVAFIDILGFSQLVESEDGTGRALAIVKRAVEQATIQLRASKKKEDGEYRFWFDEFGLKSFSDCFCFSIPLEFRDGEKEYKQNLLAFCVWVDLFCIEMLSQGFLCRGGITQGLHYLDENLIFSPAQIAAYKLESGKATYPLIMVHDDLKGAIFERDLPEKSYYPYMFAHDNSGRSFLNPFNHAIIEQMFFGPHTEEETTRIREFTNEQMGHLLKMVEKTIKQYRGEHFIDKWQWTKEFMAFVSKGKYSEKFGKGLWRG